jgi:hypothetical protein
MNLLHGWDRGDILALLGLIVAIVTFIFSLVPPLRHMTQDWWRGALLRAGFPRRKYARWFITRKWGVYENPYLDDVENLDLRNTYVPLSFRTDGTPDTLTIASDVLNDAKAGNLIIDGGPGSGKSTLLKAYGVALLQEGPLLKGPLPSRGPRLVPFLVQLRKLARSLDGGRGIKDYLLDEILVADAGMSADQARRFLEYSIRHHLAVVMFDGLDEVTADRYQPVLEAVFKFKDDNSPDCPTSQARLLLTCRRQNFLRVRDHWIPAFDARECSLAPLRNSEIFSYLDKLRPKFRPPASPEGFMQAVRASGTLELHRTPLILAMSVGLYARKQYYEIPSSIAELYRTMIREMLDRHGFRRDPGGTTLRFKVSDKYRFLREFSLDAAEQSGQFGDFAKSKLIRFAEQLAVQLDDVNDPVGMVNEIIDRSGLLSDVGEQGAYVFAHRSIQEFLAAEQLQKRADGGRSALLGKVTDPEWRQVAQFYSAGQEQSDIDDYLRELSKRDPGLAAYCLAGAKPSTKVAEAILDALEPINDMNLPALAAATISPRVPVQEMAIARLRTALTAPGNTLSIVNADVDGLLPLLNSLAGTNAAEIAALVPRIIADLPDDPRLVEPLWRCLTAPGIERLAERNEIVGRLVKLAVDPNCLEVLADQDRYDREFLTSMVRIRAYPFDHGLPRTHNLVTLLAWVEHLRMVPPTHNRFLEARAAGRLDRIEADRRRTISISPFLPARIVSGLAAAAMFVIAMITIGTGPGHLLHPYGWWTPLLIIGAAAAPIAITIGIDQFTAFRTTGHEPDSGNYFISLGTSHDNGIISALVLVTILLIAPLSFAIAPLSLATTSLASYLAVALGVHGIYWFAAFDAVMRGRRYHLYQPNKYTDVYDDPRSRHWLGLRPPRPLLQLVNKRLSGLRPAQVALDGRVAARSHGDP